MSRTFSLAIMLVIAGLVLPAHAVPILNSGFNDLTGWTTTNDATLAHPGGVAPWAWDTPVNPSLVVNATETVLPPEGGGMGITYASEDRFSQSVTFPNAGTYTFTVDVNSITGTAISEMTDGEFQFLAGGAASPVFVVPNADGWQTYSWTTNLSAGPRNVGVRNTLGAQYAIAYDNFTIIPEPTTLWLCLLGMCLAGGRRPAR